MKEKYMTKLDWLILDIKTFRLRMAKKYLEKRGWVLLYKPAHTAEDKGYATMEEVFPEFTAEDEQRMAIQNCTCHFGDDCPNCKKWTEYQRACEGIPT